MEQQDIPINAALLRWARETAGYSLQEAAERAKITAPRRKKNSPSLSAADRLASWENGEEKPTLAQLVKLAKAYRRPLITFFLARPPMRTNSMADFRAISGSPKHPTVEFAAFQRKLNNLHEELKQIVIEEGNPPLSYVGSQTPEIGVKEMAGILRNSLGIEEDIKFSRPEDYFAYLRDKAHNIGIYVLLMGDLGAWQSQISPDEFRGIAIADKYAPLVVINKYDAKAAMLFTFIHELTHIWLGFSGISNNDVFGLASTQKIEVFCNAVAAEFLVPEDILRLRWPSCPENTENEIRCLAKIFWVSEAVVARRLKDLGMLSHSEYERLFAIYQARWKNLKEKKSGGRGPDQNVLSRYWLGDKILSTFRNATANGQLTLLEAARALNLSVKRKLNVPCISITAFLWEILGNKNF